MKQRKALSIIEEFRDFTSDAKVRVSRPDQSRVRDVEMASNQKQLDEFLQKHQKECIDLEMSGENQLSLVVDGSSATKNFRSISVRADRKSHSLKSIKARNIYIEGRDILLRGVRALDVQISLRNGRVKVQDCEIGLLRLLGNSDYSECKIDVIDSSFIYIWSSASMNVRDIDIINCSFSRLDLRQIEEKLPDDIRKKYPTPLSMRDTFSAIYRLAVSGGNSSTAHNIRAEELAQEYRSARGSYKVLLFLWWLFADYGASPFRPLVFALGATFLLFLYFLFLGTAVVGDQHLGWRKLLTDAEGITDDVLRAIVGCFESALSPLSAFSYRQLIVPKTLLGAFLKATISYFALAMVILCGFSLRRRFRSFQ